MRTKNIILINKLTKMENLIKETRRTIIIRHNKRIKGLLTVNELIESERIINTMMNEIDRLKRQIEILQNK